MIWDGQPVRGYPYPYLAFDTETNIVDLTQQVPDVILMTVSNGVINLVVAESQINDFVGLYHEALWVGFNSQFDYNVILKKLMKYTGSSAVHWMDIPKQGRLHDAMILDFLVNLANDSFVGEAKMRSLKDVTQDYLGYGLSKDDDIRLQFEKYRGRPLNELDPKFLAYAVKDAIATHFVFSEIYAKAEQNGGHKIPETLQLQNGVLTERIQVGADIALHDITRRGIAIDLEKVREVRGRLETEIENQVSLLKKDYPDIFDYYKIDYKPTGARKGDLKVIRGTHTPHLRVQGLRKYLTQIARDLSVPEGLLPKTPKTGEITTALDPWRQLAPKHPFVAAWCKMADNSKLLQFVEQIKDKPYIHSEYRVLVRTGRTSSKQPNIQQMPRERWFRSLFVARPGKTLVIVDYSAIELRTLGAVLLNRYGSSALADVFYKGIDPHVYTAAMMRGEDVETFKTLRHIDPEAYTQARQAAKPVNFGVPGGLGPKRLSDYAKVNYNVDMSVEQASELRQRLITVVYPEISLYLQDEPVDRLADSLMTTPERIREVLEPPFPGFWKAAENIVAGRRKVNGEEYSPYMRDLVWGGLIEANQNKALEPFLQMRQANEILRRSIFGNRVVTLTGRVRSGCDYGEARNTPFQGLAADGAKVALWNLYSYGYQVVAFVHDEVVVEADLDKAEETLEAVERIMKESMSQVMYCSIPVEVEGHISPVWTKG
jgi:DNA polymerase I-like protein with 3'-5' exonuclease and polymerase domains